MVDFNTANESAKNIINSFLENPSENPIGSFNLQFFKSICTECTREDCIIRDTLLDADKIKECNYFTTLKER